MAGLYMSRNISACDLLDSGAWGRTNEHLGNSSRSTCKEILQHSSCTCFVTIPHYGRSHCADRYKVFSVGGKRGGDKQEKKERTGTRERWGLTDTICWRRALRL
jgi:hypothetical protein